MVPGYLGVVPGYLGVVPGYLGRVLCGGGELIVPPPLFNPFPDHAATRLVKSKKKSTKFNTKSNQIKSKVKQIKNKLKDYLQFFFKIEIFFIIIFLISRKQGFTESVAVQPVSKRYSKEDVKAQL